MCDIESTKVRLRPRVLPFDPISELRLAARERNVMRGALFLEAPTRRNTVMTKRRWRRKGGAKGSRMPLRRDAYSLNAPRRAVREEAYFARGLLAEERRSHVRSHREAETRRVSLAKEPERRRARESRAETAKLNSCATGVAVQLLGRSTFAISWEAVIRVRCKMSSRKAARRRAIDGDDCPLPVQTSRRCCY